MEEISETFHESKVVRLPRHYGTHIREQLSKAASLKVELRLASQIVEAIETTTQVLTEALAGPGEWQLREDAEGYFLSQGEGEGK